MGNAFWERPRRSDLRRCLDRHQYGDPIVPCRERLRGQSDLSGRARQGSTTAIPQLDRDPSTSKNQCVRKSELTTYPVR